MKLENILLKGKDDLTEVKIADFGLSDFYRPGAMMKSNCGTLSFLAPEVFRGTSNAGPPLDVWSLGVILFAVLCGRLPFEGNTSDTVKGSHKHRSREQIIRSRIMKCQYKIDDNIGPEAKDLVRRMLKLDPSERASIPELLGHCWLRTGIGEFGNSSKIGGSIFGNGRSRTTSSSEGKGEESSINNSNEQLDSIRKLSLELENRGSAGSQYSSVANQPGLDSSGGRTTRSNSNPSAVVESILIDDMDDEVFKDSVTNSSNSINSPAGETGGSGFESQTFKLMPLRRSKSSVAGSEIAGSGIVVDKMRSEITGEYDKMDTTATDASFLKISTREAWDEKTVPSANNIAGSPNAVGDGRLKKAGAFSLQSCYREDNDIDQVNYNSGKEQRSSGISSTGQGRTRFN